MSTKTQLERLERIRDELTATRQMLIDCNDYGTNELSDVLYGKLTETLTVVGEGREELIATLAKPRAYLTPKIMSFAGAVKTSCRPEDLKCFEGTVGWGLSLFGDTPDVVDASGNTHSAKPLFE